MDWPCLKKERWQYIVYPKQY